MFDPIPLQVSILILFSYSSILDARKTNYHFVDKIYVYENETH